MSHDGEQKRAKLEVSAYRVVAARKEYPLPQTAPNLVAYKLRLRSLEKKRERLLSKLHNDKAPEISDHYSFVDLTKALKTVELDVQELISERMIERAEHYGIDIPEIQLLPQDQIAGRDCYWLIARSYQPILQSQITKAFRDGFAWWFAAVIGPVTGLIGTAAAIAGVYLAYVALHK